MLEIPCKVCWIAGSTKHSSNVIESLYPEMQDAFVTIRQVTRGVCIVRKNCCVCTRILYVRSHDSGNFLKICSFESS